MKEYELLHKSRDYIDICYMIDHVKEYDVLIDVLTKLGYKVVPLIIRNENRVKNITIDKRNNFRIQITPKYKNINIAQSVLIKKSDLKIIKK